MIQHEQAIRAIAAVTGIPEQLLEPAGSDDGALAYKSRLSGKAYGVETSASVGELPQDLAAAMNILGEHEGCVVFEHKAWWEGLL